MMSKNGYISLKIVLNSICVHCGGKKLHATNVTLRSYTKHVIKTTKGAPENQRFFPNSFAITQIKYADHALIISTHCCSMYDQAIKFLK